MKTQELLTRDEFRERVFERDGHKCVMCESPAKDAHHIMERRLFKDGGYYLDNGASLCEKHHMMAEQTVLSCEQIRSAAKIDCIVLPEHLYDDLTYDKWGNIIMPNGMRLKSKVEGSSDPTEYLEADTEYHYRIRAANEMGESFGEDMTFRTPFYEAPPVAVTLLATNIG